MVKIEDYIPYGHENGVTRKQLARLFEGQGKDPDRMAREAIQEARGRTAVLNLGDGKGYFRPLPGEKDLVLKWKRGQNKRAEEIKKSTRGCDVWTTEWWKSWGED